MTKLVILAGGLGTRISEETHVKPKPMIEIGGKPLLWHLMKYFSQFGVDDFVVCLGYKGYVIKEYFANYFLHNSDVTFDLQKNKMVVHQNQAEGWKVTLIDTGDETSTAGRLGAVSEYLVHEEFFLFTYGDGLADVNIKNLIDFHKSGGKKATVTAVQPPGRFGALDLHASSVEVFTEKPHGDSGWINGGFFVLSPEVLKLIDSPNSSWEFDVLPLLAKEQQLQAFKHEGFWHAMDTLRDKQVLEEKWQSGNSPWRIWGDS